MAPSDGCTVALRGVDGEKPKVAGPRSSGVGGPANKPPPCPTPQRLPEPPTTVMSRNEIDRLRPKSSFDTICSIEANKAPPIPAIAPEITKASSLWPVTLIPHDAATRSSSRSAWIARPGRDANSRQSNSNITNNKALQRYP